MQVNAEILYGRKRINIADVVKPTEREVDAVKNDQRIGIGSDIVMNDIDHETNGNDSSDGNSCF